MFRENTTNMKYTALIITVLCSQLVGCAQVTIPNKDEQIAQSVQAAPEDQREAATVMGYNSNNELVVIRKGTNSLTCVSDDPQKEGFNCVCYHNDLEPFMQRGRELRTEGKGHQEIFDQREKEVQEGVLKMPENPATLHVLSGPDGRYNPETGKVENANYRYVVYISYATPESTGLPLRPMVPGGPWIMDPGTHRAHIMISPPAPE